MLANSIAYLDARLKEDYDRLLEYKADLTKKQITRLQIHYLYARSFFTEIPVSKINQLAFDYYLEQAKTYWLEESFLYERDDCAGAFPLSRRGIRTSHRAVSERKRDS